jgi:Polysaccharide lyase
MFQRIFPFVIPTYCRATVWRNGSTLGVACLALVCAVLLVPLASAHAQTVVNEDFEDGKYSGDATSMKVPPSILEENGNKFLRITGSQGDCESIPADMCPEKNRSTIVFTDHYSDMPPISESTQRQTYTAALRIGASCPNGCSVFEMYQYAPGGEGSYGTQNGTGPAARFIVKNGRSYFETRYNNETKVDQYDLGVSASSWHTYTLKANWSHDPKISRFDVYVDGNLKKTISGRDVNLGPESSRIPMVKFGLYSYNCVGTADVNDIHINPTDGGPVPEPVVSVSTPTNLRLVSGQ